MTPMVTPRAVLGGSGRCASPINTKHKENKNEYERKSA